MSRTAALSFVLGLAIGSSAHAQPAGSPALPAACRGVRDAEQQVGMFTDPRNILRIERIKVAEPASEAETPDQRAGARITILARPGVTAEWLQRVAECHLALASARHYTGATQSPLDVPGIAVFIASVGDGFAVDIVSYDVKTAREIYRRASRLARAPITAVGRPPVSPAHRRRSRRAAAHGVTAKATINEKPIAADDPNLT